MVSMSWSIWRGLSKQDDQLILKRPMLVAREISLKFSTPKTLRLASSLSHQWPPEKQPSPLMQPQKRQQKKSFKNLSTNQSSFAPAQYMARETKRPFPFSKQLVCRFSQLSMAQKPAFVWCMSRMWLKRLGAQQWLSSKKALFKELLR